MGKIATKTRSVSWPSWEAARFWGEEKGCPPYVSAQDIPAGYGFWGETVTILEHDEWRGYRFQARAYFLPLEELRRVSNEPQDPSRVQKPALQDAPLKWIVFEPITAFKGGQRYILIRPDPRNSWFFHIASGGQEAPPFVMDRPKHRTLTEREVAAYQKRFRRAAQRARKARREVQETAQKEEQKRQEAARKEQQRRQRAVGEARAAERQAAAAQKKEIVESVRQQMRGSDEGPTMTHQEADQRFARAEKMVDNAVTEDDLEQALNMVALNKMIRKEPIPNETIRQKEAREKVAEARNDRFMKKLGDQLVRLMDEAIEVLDARYRELPGSPIREWQADLERLRRLHREYHGQLRNPPYQPAVDNMRFWYLKIRQLERQRRQQAGRQGRPTQRQRGLPSSGPDPAISSEERGLPARTRTTRARPPDRR